MSFKVDLVADSISPVGRRLTTFSVKYPRFIHCFDKKTEFLSQINNEIPEFRSFEAIKTLKCKVAQYEPDTNIISFVYPLRAIESIFSGTKIEFDSKKFSMSVTDQHRVFTLRRTTNNKYLPHTDYANSLIGHYSGCRRIPQAGNLSESYRQYDNPVEAKLIAYYVADGHLTSSNKAQFHFRKERKIVVVCELLDKLNIQYDLRRYDRDAVIVFDPPAWVKHCYNEVNEKQYPNCLFGMTSRTFDAFKEGTLESDGCIVNNDINTTSYDVANQTQVLALLNGTAMNIHSYKQDGCSDLYKQSYQKTPYISFRSDKDIFNSITTQDEQVYCFTVNTGYLIVRRKGIAYISGNCELMTHRVFSRNASSSRAIPAKKIIQQVIDDPAMPVYWGSNKPGMQAGEEIDTKFEAQDYWHAARNEAVKYARKLVELGLHKQVVNRILEPWHHIHVVITATEFGNFFNLRCHPDAQPEIKVLAEMMRDKYYDPRHSPSPIDFGGWHLPFISLDDKKAGLSDLQLRQISVARCARVSYMNHDGTPAETEKDLGLYKQLFTAGHLSPFEHQAMPMINPNEYVGNFRGWIQYRKTLAGENRSRYQPPERKI